MLCDEGNTVCHHHVDTANHELEFLDANDNLYRIAVERSLEKYMPASHLIEWDCEDITYLSEFPSRPPLRKAPLGSGGFGLYFVFSKFDVLEVIRGHRKRAEEHPGFLDELQCHFPPKTTQQCQRRIQFLQVLCRNCRGRKFSTCCVDIRISCVPLCNAFINRWFDLLLPLRLA